MAQATMPHGKSPACSWANTGDMRSACEAHCCTGSQEASEGLGEVRPTLHQPPHMPPTQACVPAKGGVLALVSLLDTQPLEEVASAGGGRWCLKTSKHLHNKAIVTLRPKPDKDTIREENYRPYPDERKCKNPQ